MDDEYSQNPRFIELQEELHYVLFTSASNVGSPSGHWQETDRSIRNGDQDGGDSGSVQHRQSTDDEGEFDFSRVPSVPQIRLINYLRNWIHRFAPLLDNFDEERHFRIEVPRLARRSPTLLYAILAVSACQMERKSATREGSDSLLLYQESIRLLASSLPSRERDPAILVTACILAVLELSSGQPRNWKRHIEGCASLFSMFGVHGFSGGLLQAVFWCFARMELCGVLLSEGTETTVMPLHKWVPVTDAPSPLGSLGAGEDVVTSLFLQCALQSPGMYANWAVYLCARACDLLYRQTQQPELHATPNDRNGALSFAEQWQQLWDTLQQWFESRPPALQPVQRVAADDLPPFPTIVFHHFAAISSTETYHTACIVMLEMMPSDAVTTGPYNVPSWHARRICGISRSNPNLANLANSIQPLYLAGKLLGHPSEQIAIAKILKYIEKASGWGALWRLNDLERIWGYQPGEIMNAV